MYKERATSQRKKAVPIYARETKKKHLRRRKKRNYSVILKTTLAPLITRAALRLREMQSQIAEHTVQRAAGKPMHYWEASPPLLSLSLFNGRTAETLTASWWALTHAHTEIRAHVCVRRTDLARAHLNLLSFLRRPRQPRFSPLTVYSFEVSIILRFDFTQAQCDFLTSISSPIFSLNNILASFAYIFITRQIYTILSIRISMNLRLIFLWFAILRRRAISTTLLSILLVKYWRTAGTLITSKLRLNLTNGRLSIYIYLPDITAPLKSPHIRKLFRARFILHYSTLNFASTPPESALSLESLSSPFLRSRARNKWTMTARAVAARNSSSTDRNNSSHVLQNVI